MKKHVLAMLLAIAAIPTAAAAGEIYGTIKDQGKLVKEGVPVTMACGATSVPGATDKNGAYRLFASAEGKCTLTVKMGSESPAAVVHSYAESARYNFHLEKKDGKYTLKAE
ncbi:MAG: hypothetical protein ABIT01_03345 [Thermoanaerobaculia bacterium]